MDAAKFLRDTIDVVSQIESRFIELGKRLYKIKEDKMWEATYESYAEFLGDAKITPGHASILTTIYKAYVIDKGVSEDALYGVGYSNLYEAIPLIEGKGVDFALGNARELTRGEIKDAAREHVHGACNHKDKEYEVFHKCQCGKFYRV